MPRYGGLIALAALAIAAAVYGLRDGMETHGDMGVSRETAIPTEPIAGETAASPAPRPVAVPRGKGFDFYVLSLSWSPTYCGSDEGRGNRQQCGTDADYGLIVHGLWPQNETGYPEFCNSGEAERVPDSLGQSLFDIMPGMGLIGHEWRKHGTCSGLSQQDYFRVTRQAYERIKIPEVLKNAKALASLRLGTERIEDMFTDKNPDLGKRGIAVTCDDGKLDEVRICLTKELAFRDCPEVDRNACRLKSVDLPAIN
ncbi:ribonuclease [Agrobacterium sp. a22-2]|uniref:ribonuclease T2 family protein n=1 Tax=Agrobacterium sp. a22-2 TaxID=2283840 RepID=UPI00144707C0|nr:ribonuclease [Agrobacterium sp. a22-2]NKN38033.1 ribonuclease [Agrobacterium sp. a22-2]